MTGFLLTLVVSTTAASAPPPEVRQVGVLRVESYVRPAESLFEPVDPAAQERAKALQEYLEARLDVEPNLRVIGPAELAERLRAVEGDAATEKFARYHMALGRSKFKELAMDEACSDLETAARSYASIYYQVVDPKLMAELSLDLAKCYAESKPLDTQLALKEMFLQDPWREFRRGYFAPDFERYLQTTLRDFNVTFPKENRLGSSSATEAFLEKVALDTLVSAWVELDRGQVVARIEVIDRHSRTASYRHAFVSMDRTEDRERIDRFISRWVTCLPTPQTPTNVAPAEPENRLFIDTGFAYAIYGKDTTRRLFHNLGMGLSAEYQFLRGLGAFVQVTMLTSTQDPDRDLLDSFTAIHAIAGVSYAFRGRWWRLYVRAGFDVQFLGSYATTTDPWCKFAGRGSNRCTGGVTDLGDEIHMGFYGALGAQFFMNRNVYLTVRLSASSYIVPLDQTIEVNFPFTTELALGYSF